MEKGHNIRAVFDRFANLVKAVEGACFQVGRKLEVSPIYGNILSCPSNCGTGLRASMMIKIPLASKQHNFKNWCAHRNLHVAREDLHRMQKMTVSAMFQMLIA